MILALEVSILLLELNRLNRDKVDGIPPPFNAFFNLFSINFRQPHDVDVGVDVGVDDGDRRKTSVM